MPHRRELAQLLAVLTRRQRPQAEKTRARWTMKKGRVLGEPPGHHLAHERRRAIEAQGMNRVRCAPITTHEVRQLEVEAGLLQARQVPPGREVVLERSSMTPLALAASTTVRRRVAAIITISVVVEGGGGRVLCGDRRVLATKFGRRLAISEVRQSISAPRTGGFRETMTIK
jgi:hypothetical protein